MLSVIESNCSVRALDAKLDASICEPDAAVIERDDEAPVPLIFPEKADHKDPVVRTTPKFVELVNRRLVALVEFTVAAMNDRDVEVIELNTKLELVLATNDVDWAVTVCNDALPATTMFEVPPVIVPQELIENTLAVPPAVKLATTKFVVPPTQVVSAEAIVKVARVPSSKLIVVDATDDEVIEMVEALTVPGM